jgi:hypothetical protein
MNWMDKSPNEADSLRLLGSDAASYYLSVGLRSLAVNRH